MGPLLCVLVVLVAVSRAEIYDMANGNDEGLIYPCENGPVGLWVEEPASKYPGGPQDGLVLTSSFYSGSCLDTPTTLHITQQSKLNLYIRIPYVEPNDYFTLYLVRGTQWLPWITISGPIPADQVWLNISPKIPYNIEEGDYKVRLWDSSATAGVSLRFFEITTGNFTATTHPQDTTTHPQDTTTALWPTTERVSTLAPTTERYTTPPTLPPTTERFSTLPATTERVTTTTAPPATKINLVS